MELNVDPDAGGERGALTHTEVSAAARLKKLERRVSAIEDTPVPAPPGFLSVRLDAVEDAVDLLERSNTALCVAVSCMILACALYFRHG